MWQAGINLLAGTWVLISGFVSAAVTPANYIIVGIVIAVCGFWKSKTQWQGIVNGILGLWLIFSGLVSPLVVPVNQWIIGLVVGILASWQIWGSPRHRATA